MGTVKIHYFDDTRSAYDACMCSDDIETGDILLILDEKVVGLADTWPIAITKETGEFHEVKNEYGFDRYCLESGMSERSLEIARLLAESMDRI